MSDLGVRLREVIEGRLEVARAATPGPWSPDDPWLSDTVTSALLGLVADCSVGVGFRAQSLEDARHIALNDPADAILAGERDLDVLERHAATDADVWRYGITCRGCPNSAASWPCPEITSMARRYSVEVT